MNEETIKGTAAIIVREPGGKVIAMTDNPNFRAFWYGTINYLLMRFSLVKPLAVAQEINLYGLRAAIV